MTSPADKNPFPERNPNIPEGINASEEHPLKEFSLLLLGIGSAVILLVIIVSLLARQLSPFIPFAWEQEMAQETVSMFKQKTEPEVRAALNEILDKLVAVADLPEGMEVSIHYMDDSKPNAFATLGGHVFVTRGLLERVDSENALAMVIAHEIGHIKHRHPIQALSRGAVIQLVLTVLLGEGAGAGHFIGQTGLLTLLSFNREMEHDSDREAMAILQKHYGHLGDADTFFKKMLARYGSAGALAFFQTHPDLKQRIERLQQQTPADDVQLTPLPAALQF